MKGGEPFFIKKQTNVGVLLLHGFTSTPHQFKELGGFLVKKGCTVYAPLIAGHGTTPKDLSETTIVDWKQSVEEAYHELRKTVQHVVIVGNSFGGNLAFYLARSRTDPPLGIISLGTPITLRAQWFIKLRFSVYGWTKQYYRKPQRIYKIDYTDLADEVTYPVIPIKSLRNFFAFIKEETIPHLKDIRVPTLIVHASVDPVVSTKSAPFIHEHLGSAYKKIYWFHSNHHVMTIDEHRERLFQKIYDFIQEIQENDT